jgi:hypothetical protein
VSRSHERAAVDLAPFELFESRAQPGTWCLRLMEDDMVEVMDVFDDHAQYGNGHAWNAVARQIVRTYATTLRGRFHTDPDPMVWLAYGPDRHALVELGVRMSEAWHHRRLLSELIAGADPRWFD